jgi:hypothetical protein
MTITLPFPDDPWARDVALVIVGWLLVSALAVVLLLTVVRWAFL